MSQIRCIYRDGPPNFPPSDQHPDALRYTVGALTVDAIGGPPTQAEIDAVLGVDAVALSEKSRRQAIHDDPLRVDLMSRVKTATTAQISAYVDANVTDIASARAMFKRILLLIALDARNGG